MSFHIIWYIHVELAQYNEYYVSTVSTDGQVP